MGITHIKGQPLNKGRGKHGSMMRNALIAKAGVPEWMVKANQEYGIPLENLQKAYEEFPDVQWCFKQGKTPYIIGNNNTVIDTDYLLRSETLYIKCKSKINKISDTYYIYRMSGSYNRTLNLRSPILYFCTPTPYLGLGSGDYSTKLNEILSIGSIVEAEIFIENNNSHGTINGHVFNLYFSGSVVNDVPYRLFGIKGDYVSYNACQSQSLFVLKDNDNTALCMVPFLSNGIYGMLNLMTMKFYGNVNFTYVLE